jgi:hypothetical protein
MAIIASVFGCQNDPTFDLVLASAGQSQSFETPTTLSPSPKAKTISVRFGETETIRWGEAAAAPQKNTNDSIVNNFFIFRFF